MMIVYGIAAAQPWQAAPEKDMQQKEAAVYLFLVFL